MSTDSNDFEGRYERRAAQRFAVHLPLTVRFEAWTVPGYIQDLSGRGIFFYAECALAEGAVVELTFTMPSEITLAESMPMRCRGRVLRASTSNLNAGHAHAEDHQRTGFAVRFDSYEYLPSNEPAMQFVRVSEAAISRQPSAIR
jgi:PilZ domain